MKSWFVAALVAVVTVVGVAEAQAAKRLGGGKSVGMQRSAPSQAAPQTPPKPAGPAQAAPQQAASPQPAAPAAAPATAAATQAAAAPAKRSWLGPIAGLAAGLGLAALMNHLGLGEAFANFLMLALLAVAAVFLVTFLMRRFGGGARTGRLATAGASVGPSVERVDPVLPRDEAPRASPSAHAFTPAAADVSVTGRPLPVLGQGVDASQPERSSVASPAASTGLVLPEGFDLPSFQRVAKMIFIRLQAAHDAGDLDDLRQFTTPEMFATLRLDLQERGGALQSTDVERVDATVVDYAVESGRQIISVRFQGLIREDAQAAAAPFDEVWHLVRPDSGEGSWAIAGIQQTA